MLMFFKIIGAIITLYLVVMLVKELIKIVKEKDDYDDKVDLP
jgi:hypothetical protein